MDTTRKSLWLLPAVIIVLILALYPAIWTGYTGLFDWKFGFPRSEANFVGLNNYLKLIKEPMFWRSVVTTGIFVVSSVSIQLLLGLAIALLLNTEIKGISFYRSFFMIPMVLMDSMIGLTWRLYYAENGIYNYFLSTFFGKPINWYNTTWALPGVIIAEVWRWTPFFILMILAGLQSISKDLYEAAVVDGGSKFQLFRHISLPLLTPLITIGVILRFIDSMKLFGMIFAMFGGGPGNATETLPIHIYRTSLLSKNVGMGMAKAMVLLIFILILGLIFIKVHEKLGVKQ